MSIRDLFNRYLKGRTNAAVVCSGVGNILRNYGFCAIGSSSLNLAIEVVVVVAAEQTLNNVGILSYKVINLCGFRIFVGADTIEAIVFTEVVNNGIVLVEFVNQLREEGMEKREALIEAGKTRMRPILMTTITTILGLLDMALNNAAGTALMRPIKEDSSRISMKLILECRTVPLKSPVKRRLLPPPI